MKFKAKMASTLVLNVGENDRDSITDDEYVFSRKKVYVPSGQVVVLRYKPVPDIVVNKSTYTLSQLDKDDDEESYSKNSKFQALFDNGLALNLVTTPFQEWKLRCVHELTWIQKYRLNILSYVATIFATFLAGWAVATLANVNDVKEQRAERISAYINGQQNIRDSMQLANKQTALLAAYPDSLHRRHSDTAASDTSLLHSNNGNADTPKKP